MKVEFVRELSENTSLYQCDPPMRFIKPQEKIMAEQEIVDSALVVAWCGEVAPGMHRTVLHSAHLLAGDEGIGFGADGNRLFDAKLSHQEALKIAGYELD